MEPGKVDEDGSIRLDALVPGAFYEPEMIGPDEIKLRRVNSPRRKMTWEEAKKAMETSRLEFTASWEELRRETRE